MASKKIVSFNDRANTPWHKSPANIHGSYDVYELEDSVVNGRVVKKSVIQTVRPSERFAQFKASDFALENVIAAGAVDLLKPTMLHDGDIDSLDMIDDTLNGIMDQIDADQTSKITDNE